MVAGRFGRGVGGVGREGCLFGEGGIGERKGAVDFVGGDVEKAEGDFARRRQRVPVEAGAVEEAEGADDVGLDERLGGIDGAVDVGLGGEIDDGVDLVLGEEAGDEGGVTNVAMGENVARVGREVGEVGGVARVGEGVEVDQPCERRAIFEEALTDEIAADESGAAGDQNFHAESFLGLSETLKFKTEMTGAYELRPVFNLNALFN